MQLFKLLFLHCLFLIKSTVVALSFFCSRYSNQTIARKVRVVKYFVGFFLILSLFSTINVSFKIRQTFAAELSVSAEQNLPIAQVSSVEPTFSTDEKNLTEKSASAIKISAQKISAVNESSSIKEYLPTENWKASWITAAEVPEPAPANLWIAFRKDVDLETVPEHLICRIACDSKYWLYVNGKMRVFEGQLKRGPTPSDTYYDIVDIADFLEPGVNQIAVLVWYFGKDSFSHISSGVPGLLFEASSDPTLDFSELPQEILTKNLSSAQNSLPTKVSQTTSQANTQTTSQANTQTNTQTTSQANTQENTQKNFQTEKNSEKKTAENGSKPVPTESDFVQTNNSNFVQILSDSSWKASLYSAIPIGTVKNPQTGKPDFVWKDSVEGAYELYTADPQPNFRLSESNVRFDARFDFPFDWKTTAVSDLSWNNAVELALTSESNAEKNPWGKLYRRPIPLWKNFGLKEYVNQSELPEVSDGSPIVCQLPYNAQITPYFIVDAPGNNLIDIRTDNYFGGSAYNVRAEYITKTGLQEYESLGWMNGNQVLYTFPTGTKIVKLMYRETGFNAEMSGQFECNEAFYSNLYRKAARTLYLTMRDTYFDCPDRERAQWWGDAVNELGEAFYALDRRSDLLAKKGLYELMHFQRSDGTVFAPIPSKGWDKELPCQMLATLSTFGLGTYEFYSGDFQTGKELYPFIRKYAQVWTLADDGLVNVRSGDWSWGDWGENIDLRVLTNCWYYLFIQQTQKIAKSLNLTEDAAEYQAILDSIERNFDSVFWNGFAYRNPQYSGKTDDRSQAMAVVSGLAKSDKFEQLRAILLEEEHASPYMEKYVLEALYQMDFPNDALNRMQKRFGKMVNEPNYSTLWEGWGLGEEGFGGGTMNHAWSGGGLTCLMQYAVGVRPLEPGFKKFIVDPKPGRLTEIYAQVPTNFGQINVELKRDSQTNRLKMTVFVPEGTTAVLDKSGKIYSPGKHVVYPEDSAVK